MHLIVIVVALLIERTLGQIGRLRRIDTFALYLGLIERLPPGRILLSRPAGVLVLVPPLAAVGGVQWWLAGHAGLSLQLLFALVGLLISLGPADLWEDVYALAHARGRADHDEVEAREMALARWATGRTPVDSRAETILGVVLIEGHERLLGVLLWFFLAGPAGAVFYRLVRELPALAAREPEARATARLAAYLHGVAAFVPARLVALVYLIVGRSGRGLTAWRRHFGLTVRLRGAASWRLLAAVGRGALGIEHAAGTSADKADPQDEMLFAALSLINRSLIVVLAGLALATLAGIAR